MITRQIILITGFLVSSTIVAYSADGSGAGSTPQTEAAGRWVTEAGTLEVELAPSGEELNGTVARVISNHSMSGSKEAPATDAASLVGMKILQNMVPSGKNEWKGHIFNRENGKTYDCVMTYVPPDRLNIRGYVVLPLFGKTQVWHRVTPGAQ